MRPTNPRNFTAHRHDLSRGSRHPTHRQDRLIPQIIIPPARPQPVPRCFHPATFQPELGSWSCGRAARTRRTSKAVILSPPFLLADEPAAASRQFTRGSHWPALQGNYRDASPAKGDPARRGTTHAQRLALSRRLQGVRSAYTLQPCVLCASDRCYPTTSASTGRRSGLPPSWAPRSSGNSSADRAASPAPVVARSRPVYFP